MGDFDSFECGRDIIVKKINGTLQRIPKTHTSFMPLQYPLLFPYGEDGFQEDILFHPNFLMCKKSKRKHISLCEFVSFRIQDRPNEETMLLFSRRLFQQFIVDYYSMVEFGRLSFVRNNQHTIRKEYLSGIKEAVDRGDVDAIAIGTRTVLPIIFH